MCGKPPSLVQDFFSLFITDMRLVEEGLIGPLQFEGVLLAKGQGGGTKR
jgi:hypothetical protein